MMAFLVWKRGQRGPTASKDTFDPRSSLDWKIEEQYVLQIVPLTPAESEASLDALIKTYPAPRVPA